ncbi:MAG: sodium-dependent transporter [Clostridia bacterium]|nr:sodium-dependent transporter [Clostridia bacterium]
MQENKTKKSGFTSAFGFIMAAAGSAVGLGNLWGFPYKTAENGGAAFVFIYILCVLFIGSITMICEIFIGRRSQANPVTAFKKANKNLGWIGLLAIIVPTIIVCYYSVLGGYTVNFAVNSFVGNAGKLSEFAGSGWVVVLFALIFVALSLVVVMAGIKGGIEKASKVLMPALFILLVAVVIFVLCLGEGVAEGLAFYLIPDFSKVTFGSVLAAMGQAFYSLSLGMGTMIVYGSYTGKEINIVKSTGMVCIFDTLVALLAGLAIFPAVFHFASVSGVDISTLKLNGIMLMFETLPKVFESIGYLGNIIEFFFFAMVTIAAVTSVISIMEVASQFVIQKFKIKRKIATTIVAVITFAVSVPVSFSLGHLLNGSTQMTIFGCDWLTFLDTVTNIVLMPICALLSCVTVGWFIGPKQTMCELKADGSGFGKLEGFISVMMKFVVPVLIAVIEVFGLIDLIFPQYVFSANGLGIALVSFAILGILIGLYFIFLRKVETGTNADELVTDGAIDGVAVAETSETVENSETVETSTNE